MDEVKPQGDGFELRQRGPEGSAGEKRPYRAPRLELFGDIRSLTLGGSPGNGDSVVLPPTFP